MAESIAAIGLAGNIIQFISFTFVLVSKSREIYYSASGAADEIVDLEIIAQDIEILCDEFRLREGLDDWRLVDMANRCKAVAEELQDAISDLQSGIKGKESRIENTKWKSFRTALRSVWGKKRVEELKSRLESLRDQVTMQLISYTK